MIRYALGFLMGVAAVLAYNQFLPKPPKPLALTRHAITISRPDLKNLLRAIVLVDDKNEYRYESDDGNLAFECPTDRACNLEVPAQDRVAAHHKVVRIVQRGDELPQVSDLPPGADEVRDVIAEPIPPRTAVPAANALAERVSDSAPLTALARFGMKSGDTILGINGEVVATPMDAMERLNELVSQGQKIKEILIERGGTKMRLAAGGYGSRQN